MTESLRSRCLAMLKELEYLNGLCSVCHRNWPHHPGCTLVALIQELNVPDAQEPVSDCGACEDGWADHTCVLGANGGWGP
jgi:hypothetical protein